MIPAALLSLALPYVGRVLPYLLVAVIAGGSAFHFTALHYTSRLAQVQTAQAQAIAEANEQYVAEVHRINAEADKQVDAMVQELQTRTATYNTLRKEILSAKNSKACASSGPVRALLSGLRQQEPTTR